MLGLTAIAAAPIASTRRLVQLYQMVAYGPSTHFGSTARLQIKWYARPIGRTTHFGVPKFTRRHQLADLLSMLTPNVSMQEAPRAITVAYGDGYATDMPDGLAAVTRTLTLVWDGILESELNQVVAFFQANTGRPMSFRAPRELTPRNWLLTNLKRTKPYPDAGSMTATLTEVYSDTVYH